MRNLLLITFAFLLSLGTMAQTYLSESFEGTWSGTPAVPAGWSITHTTATGGTSGTDPTYWAKNTWSGAAWSSTSNGTPTTPAGAYDLSSVAWYNDYNAKATQKDQLSTGNVDLSISTSPRCTFYLALSSSSIAVVKLRGSNNGGSTWSDIQTVANPGLAWTKITISIPASYKVSNARFGIEVTASWGSYDVWVDKFIIEETPPPLTGTKTIKSSGGDYSTFTAAITALNNFGVGNGGVTFIADDDMVFTEDPPAITATGTSANPVVFQRGGLGTNRPVIKPTGTAGTSDFGICISGGDYITFDGIDVYENSGSNVEYGFLIRNGSGTDGAQYNTIKNSKVTLNKTNTTSAGIMQTSSSSYGGGFTPSGASGMNSYNKYYNVTVENAYSGIWLYSYSSYYDTGNEIGGISGGTTVIGASSSNDIGNGANAVYGIYAYYQSGLKIYNTELRNVTGTGTSSVYGIYAYTLQGTNQIYNNKIHDIATTNTAGGTIYGLYVYYPATLVNVYNNLITSVAS
ncbi:MAG: right-handed parallel beta-helix repeat-containing protein [Bacteroidota bacterium]